ncbi:uncharacterized protein N7496_001955 [Penicillium cataractarum]|uniref:Myb-like DNA-binding domain-containing protein n=1 Tax=Penicillium cataractarum TaxID=2100454 RepID=A0A9W9VWX8_9EURO|nr:uncharacterized protein N7496_001955 [Penicillium cataractarum]KAJ5390887.1 hypothetical protein N7496_001955 [Penicillium cataractarum]
MSSPSKEKGNVDDSPKDPMWFLINVIMSTQAKKLDGIDWAGLCQKMDIKSKGAAMKRYERLLGTYGLTTHYLPKQGVTTPGPGHKSAARSASTPTKKLGVSKRKGPSPEKDADKEV